MLIFALTMFDSLIIIFLTVCKDCQNPCCSVFITLAWQDALPYVKNDVLEGPWPHQSLVLALCAD